MVTSSLYRLNGRSKSYNDTKKLKVVLDTQFENIVLFPNPQYLFKLNLLQIKKGVLKSTPPHFQSTRNTLAVLSTINPRS